MLRALALLALLSASCGSTDTSSADLVIGAYTAPREAFEDGIIPAFKRRWKEQTGQDLVVRSSYLGSGAQARAVADGFEADVVVLALDADVEKIVKAGLIDANWRARGGLLAHSLVVIAVRAGNPLGIHDFADLTQRGFEVLTPNPRTSGGAMWNLLAVYGAGGEPLVRAVAAHIVVLDKGARESIINFERGIGDAAITYEQEVYAAHAAGRRYDCVIPPATIRVDVSVAIVDRYVDRHRRRAVAEAFVDFLHSPEGQAILVARGFRPTSVAPPGDLCGPEPTALFTIDRFGGWKKASQELFGPTGTLTRVLEEGGE